MSIQIHNDGLAGTSAQQAERAHGSAIGPGNAPKQSPGLNSTGGDNVAISSLSESIAAATQLDEVQHAGRVRQLAALYQSGQYHVDSLQLSRTLVSQALETGTAESGH
jgi:anti-sigma28 factor (negative regulator of flagellin synthesis)